MPNPQGKNGWGKKEYPPDNILKETLLKYALRKYTIEEKLSRLEADLKLSIGKSKLNELERKFEIPTVRRPYLNADTIEFAVAEEVKKDTNQRCGPVYIQSKLKDNLIMVPRDTVRRIMHTIAPEGFDRRFPSNRKSKIQRKTLKSAGPFREVSSDGHEKLNAQALQMGEISLPIYGYKDKWSGCIPVQMTTDKGSEVGWQFALQHALRDMHAPDIDADAYPPLVMLPSTRNTPIESFWRWFLEKTGRNLKDIILSGKQDNIFHIQSDLHRDLLYWIFVPLIQEELDAFSSYWNQRRVRRQPQKVMPSGHIPIDALEHPHFFEGIDCLIRVPKESIQELRNYLTEEVGPKDHYLSWYSEEFGAAASEAYQLLGEPSLTFETAWDTFSMMVPVIQEILFR